MLRDQATWSRICVAARQITVELLRSWDAERANRAAEDMAQREAELEEIMAHRAEVVAARNNRRYARRREQRGREREERRGGRSPSPPPSSSTSSRREANRVRMSLYRQRHRSTNMLERLFDEKERPEYCIGGRR